MATKKKALPSMKTTRQRKPPKEVAKPFKLLRSTPQGTDMFDQGFPTLAAVKNAAKKTFRDHIAWCRKYPSTSDVAALEKAIERVDAYTASERGFYVTEAVFDLHYGMKATATIWREG